MVWGSSLGQLGWFGAVVWGSRGGLGQLGGAVGSSEEVRRSRKSLISISSAPQALGGNGFTQRVRRFLYETRMTLTVSDIISSLPASCPSLCSCPVPLAGIQGCPGARLLPDWLPAGGRLRLLLPLHQEPTRFC